MPEPPEPPGPSPWDLIRERWARRILVGTAAVATLGLAYLATSLVVAHTDFGKIWVSPLSRDNRSRRPPSKFARSVAEPPNAAPRQDPRPSPGVRSETQISRKSEGPRASESFKLVEVGRLRGHSGPVQDVVFSPDGRRILSGSQDRTMILWDWETGQMIRRFVGDGGWVLSVAFSPDGRRALSGGEDRVIRLWDIKSAAMIREFRGHTEWIFQVAFSPDGRLAYSTSGGPNHLTDGRDSAVRFWDLEAGCEIGRMEGHKGRVPGLAVVPDGRRVLTGGDTRLILWDAQARSQIRLIGRHDNKISCVVLLPDGRRVVSASVDRTIRIWDLEGGQMLRRFLGHPREVTWVAASPDGRLLLSSDYSAPELRLWDVESGKPLDRLGWDNANPIHGSFTPDGRGAVWGGSDNVVRVYELRGPTVSNLLKNAGFEAGFEGWTTFTTRGPKPQFDLDTQEVREGRQAIRISAGQRSDSGCYQEVMLKPGHRYRFSGWARTRGLNAPGAGVYGTFAIQRMGARHGNIAGGPNHGGDTEWTEVTLTFEAPAEGPTRIVGVHVNFGTGTGTVWFDDFKLVEVDQSAR
jgi:WD40 repeat protein